MEKWVQIQGKMDWVQVSREYEENKSSGSTVSSHTCTLHVTSGCHMQVQSNIQATL